MSRHELIEYCSREQNSILSCIVKWRCANNSVDEATLLALLVLLEKIKLAENHGGNSGPPCLLFQKDWNHSTHSRTREIESWFQSLSMFLSRVSVECIDAKACLHSAAGSVPGAVPHARWCFITQAELTFSFLHHRELKPPAVTWQTAHFPLTCTGVSLLRPPSAD